MTTVTARVPHATRATRHACGAAAGVAAGPREGRRTRTEADGLPACTAGAARTTGGLSVSPIAAVARIGHAAECLCLPADTAGAPVAAGAAGAAIAGVPLTATAREHCAAGAAGAAGNAGTAGGSVATGGAEGIATAAVEGDAASAAGGGCPAHDRVDAGRPGQTGA